MYINSMKGTIKTVFLGESNTGKTSMVYRMMKNEFDNNSESTIGASFVTVKYDDITYQIWDTAGQERYNSLIPMYCKNAELIFFVFDLNNPESINRLDFYMDKLNLDPDKNIRFMLIGNKLDLVKGVSPIISGLIDDKIEKHTKLRGKTEHVNVSAKDATNFDILIDKMRLQGQKIIKDKSNDPRNKTINLNDPIIKEEDGKCSC